MQKPPSEHGREAEQHSAWRACGVPAPGMSPLCPGTRCSLVLPCWSRALAKWGFKVWWKEVKQASGHPGPVKCHPPHPHQHLMPSSSTKPAVPSLFEHRGMEERRWSVLPIAFSRHLHIYCVFSKAETSLFCSGHCFVRAFRSLVPLDLVIRSRQLPPGKPSICAEHRRVKLCWSRGRSSLHRLVQARGRS